MYFSSASYTFISTFFFSYSVQYLVQLRDLGSNFFATHNDIGKERDTTIMAELRQMNDGVQIRTVYAGSEGTPAQPLDQDQRDKLLKTGKFGGEKKAKFFF